MDKKRFKKVRTKGFAFPDGITVLQINYILGLLNRLPPETVVRLTKERDFLEFTKKEASDFIQLLEKEVKEYESKKRKKKF